MILPPVWRCCPLGRLGFDSDSGSSLGSRAASMSWKSSYPRTGRGWDVGVVVRRNFPAPGCALGAFCCGRGPCTVTALCKLPLGSRTVFLVQKWVRPSGLNSTSLNDWQGREDEPQPGRLCRAEGWGSAAVSCASRLS